MRMPMLECLRVTRVLQSYLDGVVDEVTARRVAAHLEDCRRCGLRADTYAAIKTALARHEPTPPPALTRLREFAGTLATDEADPPGEVG
jgi:predicted anti-sigma-YlaC factor YlaD